MYRLLLLLLLAVGLAAPLAAQTTHNVTVGNFFFDTNDLTIEVGDTVIWTNVAGFHSVDGSADTFPGNPASFGNVPASSPWTYSFTFTLAGTYQYRCEVHPVQMQGTVTVTTPSSSEDVEPAGFDLRARSANPFRGDASFALTTVQTERVRIAVFDVRGREVEVLHEGTLLAGAPFSFAWSPATAHAGVYLLRVQGATFRTTRKLVYLP